MSHTMKITISERSESPGEALDYFTSDKDLALAMIARGHDPIRVVAENNTLTFVYLLADIEGDKDKLLCGEPITVNIHDIWRADRIWQMSLTQLKTIRKRSA